MAYIVRYVKQSYIDTVEKRRGEKLTYARIERMKDQVRVETEGAAIRLVEHLRLTGCLASYYHESELK